MVTQVRYKTYKCSECLYGKTKENKILMDDISRSMNSDCIVYSSDLPSMFMVEIESIFAQSLLSYLFLQNADTLYGQKYCVTLLSL